MPNPVEEANKVGAGRSYENPNDPALVGTYSDPVEKMSPDQKSPLTNFPKAPDPSPFKIKGG